MNNTNNHTIMIETITSVDSLFNRFKLQIQETLKHKKYSKSTMKEKSKEWNVVANSIMSKLDDESLKEELAFKMTKFMIEKSLQLANEYPYINPELERRFIKSSSKNHPIFNF